MKSIFLIVSIALATTVLPAQTKKKATPVAKPAAASTIKPVVIPSDATPNPDGTYSYVDKKGKHWTYTRTPFGLSRTEDITPSPNAAKISTDQFITVTETSDGYKFNRKTPFGVTSWERKAADINDEERRAIATHKQKTAPSPQQ